MSRKDLQPPHCCIPSAFTWAAWTGTTWHKPPSPTPVSCPFCHHFPVWKPQHGVGRGFFCYFVWGSFAFVVVSSTDILARKGKVLFWWGHTVERNRGKKTSRGSLGLPRASSLQDSTACLGLPGEPVMGTGTACPAEPVVGTAALHHSRTRLMGDQSVNTELGTVGQEFSKIRGAGAVSQLPRLGHCHHRVPGS